MAKFEANKKRGQEAPKIDVKEVSKVNTPKNSYDTTYQSPSHKNRKSVKVFEETYELVEEIKFATKEKSNIDVYKKAIEYYAQNVLK